MVWVDCWSCDEYEDEFGDDQTRPLTSRALREFHRSRASVKIFQGHSMHTCASITPTPKPITTRWDAAIIQCLKPGEKCTTTTAIGYNKAYPTVPMDLASLPKA